MHIFSFSHSVSVAATRKHRLNGTSERNENVRVTLQLFSSLLSPSKHSNPASVGGIKCCTRWLDGEWDELQKKKKIKPSKCSFELKGNLVNWQWWKWAIDSLEWICWLWCALLFPINARMKKINWIWYQAKHGTQFSSVVNFSNSSIFYISHDWKAPECLRSIRLSFSRALHLRQKFSLQNGTSKI